MVIAIGYVFHLLNTDEDGCLLVSILLYFILGFIIFINIFHPFKSELFKNLLIQVINVQYFSNSVTLLFIWFSVSSWRKPNLFGCNLYIRNQKLFVLINSSYKFFFLIFMLIIVFMYKETTNWDLKYFKIMFQGPFFHHEKW